MRGIKSKSKRGSFGTNVKNPFPIEFSHGCCMKKSQLELLKKSFAHPAKMTVAVVLALLAAKSGWLAGDILGSDCRLDCCAIGLQRNDRRFMAAPGGNRFRCVRGCFAGGTYWTGSGCPCARRVWHRPVVGNSAARPARNPFRRDCASHRFADRSCRSSLGQRPPVCYSRLPAAISNRELNRKRQLRHNGQRPLSTHTS